VNAAHNISHTSSSALLFRVVAFEVVVAGDSPLLVANKKSRKSVFLSSKPSIAFAVVAVAVAGPVVGSRNEVKSMRLEKSGVAAVEDDFEALETRTDAKEDAVAGDEVSLLDEDDGDAVDLLLMEVDGMAIVELACSNNFVNASSPVEPGEEVVEPSAASRSMLGLTPATVGNALDMFAGIAVFEMG
jgi:hypothetical protein